MHALEENKVKEMTSSKKILVVHNYYQIPGGEDTVVSNEMQLLQEHGHEVLLYSRNNSELKTFSKIQKLFLPITTVFNPRTYKEVKQIIRKNKIDIIHVHNTLNLVSPSVYYAAKSCKVPVVQTIHNFRLVCPAATFYREGHICEECVEKGLSCAVKYKCYRGSRVQTLACVISTKIHRILGTYRRLNYICLTEFNKEKLLGINVAEKKEIINAKRVFVKPNMTFETVKESESQVENYYLFVGRVEKIKGLEILIKAFEGLSSEKLLIAGKGTEFEEYKNFVEQQNIKNVEFLGFQSKEQLQPLMQKAKAMIVPSQWYEGFPMTIVEAFSLGTPVIGSDIGNVGSLIVENVNGWKFSHDSVEDLQKKIMVCSQTPREELQVICDEKLLPEGNYQTLMKIYDHAIQNQ